MDSTQLRTAIRRLARKLRSGNWKLILKETWDKIVLFSKKAGRGATRQALTVFYAVSGNTLPLKDRIILLAALSYIIIPSDLVPFREYGFLGILDDATVVAYLEGKLRRCITPELNEKVESTLNVWFGPERVYRQVRASGEGIQVR